MGRERWEATWLQRHKATRRGTWWWYLSGSSRLQQHAPHFSSFISSTSLRKFAATQAPKVLNVHIIPHTHDDVGWRKTVEQYFYGYNESIDARGRVQDIITTSIAALLEQPARTFVWTESKFLHMWWNEMKTRNRTALHDDLRYLIATQQWSFVNGGWCMHDEASTHYVGMLDQTTLGHDFLLHNLGVVPTVGWQLDPFGHAATQAGLLTAGVGFDALYFGRIDTMHQTPHRPSTTQPVWGLMHCILDALIIKIYDCDKTGRLVKACGKPPVYCRLSFGA